MAVVVWSNQPRYASLCVLINRGEASAALVRETQDTEEEADDVWAIYFKKSEDGLVWPPDSEAVRVGEVDSPDSILLRQKASGDYEIENGKEILFHSSNAGQTSDDWEEGATP